MIRLDGRICSRSDSQDQLTELFMLSREVRLAAQLCLPLVAGGLLLLTGCPGETPQAKKGTTTAAANADHDHDHDHDHGHHHDHAEKGPHGGALAAVGEEDAHLEFVLDADSGKLKAYVLDGDADEAVAIKQASLQLAVTLRKGDDEEKSGLSEDAFVMMLSAVSPADDGTASEFEGQSDTLKGAEKFAAVVTNVAVAGKSFKNVAFKYPEGNEEEHHHH
jgi:hypothetical protein